MSKTWLITGTSRGFGREWAIAALERGDRVAATARNVSSLAELKATYGDRILPIALDVTDRAAAFHAVAEAHAKLGSLDVVVNNAGYGLFGMIEELSEAQARAQMETNFFGALWVTQAALPILRAQHRGHILQVSSIGGITAFPGLGLYHASKWALEGMSQALAGETRRLRRSRDAHRARRVRHRLGRLVRRPGRAARGVRPGSRAHRRDAPGDDRQER
jgi:NAD(P)-dependent dehydrogenase (short-subunit alcohol dehydrogenase family)